MRATGFGWEGCELAGGGVGFAGGFEETCEETALGGCQGCVGGGEAVAEGGGFGFAGAGEEVVEELEGGGAVAAFVAERDEADTEFLIVGVLR